MTIAGDRDAAASARDDRRWRELDYCNRYSSLKRLRKCRKVMHADEVQVVVNEQRAHFRGLVSCASVHACPVCSAKIRQRRAEQVETLLDRHLRVGGGGEFVTLTVPHDYGQPLAELLRVVQSAWNALQRNRDGRVIKERFGFVGFVRALEVNHGPNGWHPHLHVLWLTSRPLKARERRALQNRLYLVWSEAAEAGGLRRPTERNGVEVRRARSGALGQYLVGLELARLDLKSGVGDHRSAFRILSDVVETGDVADQLRWREYEQATHGRRALTWSRGLKALYAIEDQTDEEIAEEEAPGEPVASIDPVTWGVIASTRDARADLKRAAVAGAAVEFVRAFAREGPDAVARRGLARLGRA